MTDPEQVPTASAPGDTTVPASDTGTQTSEVAAVAAARRRGRRPGATAAPEPGPAPAAVDGVVPDAIATSRTLVAEHLGSGGPARPAPGVWGDAPFILEVAPGIVGGVQAHDTAYVIATCDASENMIPPNAKTPVSRLLWRKGMRVRRDLYMAVMANHAARVEAGTVADTPHAALPVGVDELPPEVIAPEVLQRATNIGLIAGSA